MIDKFITIAQASDKLFNNWQITTLFSCIGHVHESIGQVKRLDFMTFVSSAGIDHVIFNYRVTDYAGNYSNYDYLEHAVEAYNKLG